MFAGVPHHVTQRGNHRERVFFNAGDPPAYLQLLNDQARSNGVDVVAYCLMPNHVHFVVIPPTADALRRLLKAVHGQFAQRINRMTGQKGHLWQGRFFSSALDSSYFVNAVRYVELNPVRARMVARAEDYDWSSAAAHCGLRSDLLVHPDRRHAILAQIADWSRWLAQGVADDSLATLRRNGSQNLPCGSEEFVDSLEALAGRKLRFQTHGGRREILRIG